MKCKEMILNLANCIEGSCLRIKEIHWNTHNQATHNLSSDIMPELAEHMDSLLELLMGVMADERPGFDILKPMIPATKNLKDILKALVMKVEATKMMADEPMYNGIAAQLDELTIDLNKWIYLSDNF